jgi:hypothetical protein
MSEVVVSDGVCERAVCEEEGVEVAKVPRLEGEGRDSGQRVYIAEGEGSHFSRRVNPRGEAGRSLGRGLMQQRMGEISW